MAKEVAKQQELTKEQSEAIALYNTEMDQWYESRRRYLVGMASMVVIQVPLWWLSFLAAGAYGMSANWAGFFSLAMFGGASVCGVIFLITAANLIFALPPRRPSILGR